MGFFIPKKIKPEDMTPRDHENLHDLIYRAEITMEKFDKYRRLKKTETDEVERRTDEYLTFSYSGQLTGIADAIRICYGLDIKVLGYTGDNVEKISKAIQKIKKEYGIQMNDEELKDESTDEETDT